MGFASQERRSLPAAQPIAARPVLRSTSESAHPNHSLSHCGAANRSQERGTSEGVDWRRERDSNPRTVSRRRFSRPVLSTAQPSLQGDLYKQLAKFGDLHLLESMTSVANLRHAMRATGRRHDRVNQGHTIEEQARKVKIAAPGANHGALGGTEETLVKNRVKIKVWILLP